MDALFYLFSELMVTVRGVMLVCVCLLLLNLVQRDLQSAGMVCFYMMSGGIHPYAADGSRIKAQTRIVDGDYDLSAVDDPVACDLVKHMLAPKPRERPSAGELLR